MTRLQVKHNRSVMFEFYFCDIMSLSYAKNIQHFSVYTQYYTYYRKQVNFENNFVGLIPNIMFR